LKIGLGDRNLIGRVSIYLRKTALGHVQLRVALVHDFLRGIR
jgi:hypothetical protein